MKTIKYPALVLAGLIAAAAVYGQNTAKTKNVIKPATAKTSHSSLSKPNSSSRAGATSVDAGAISANPVVGRDLAEREAAYAPSDALRRQAITLSEAGDLKGAEAACIDALNSPPIIRGQPQHVPFVAQLLGQIYLKDGQYEKAVQWLQGARPNTAGGSLNLDLALAYVRLGDYAHAQECYSDRATLRYYSEGTSQDLPGADSPQALEASILLARGLDAYLEHWYDDALPDLQRANKLAPGNAVIAYHCAQILNEKGRYAEAAPLYEIAAARGHGIIGDDAKRRSAGTHAATTQLKQ